MGAPQALLWERAHGQRPPRRPARPLPWTLKARAPFDPARSRPAPTSHVCSGVCYPDTDVGARSTADMSQPSPPLPPRTPATPALQVRLLRSIKAALSPRPGEGHPRCLAPETTAPGGGGSGPCRQACASGVLTEGGPPAPLWPGTDPRTGSRPLEGEMSGGSRQSPEPEPVFKDPRLSLVCFTVVRSESVRRASG